MTPMENNNGINFISQLLEEQVLSLVLNYPANLETVVNTLREEDFYYRNNRELFIVFKKIYEEEKPINDDIVLIEANKMNFTDSIDVNFLKHIYFCWAFQNSLNVYMRELMNLTNLRFLEFKCLETLDFLQEQSKNKKRIESNEIVNDIKDWTEFFKRDVFNIEEENPASKFNEFLTTLTNEPKDKPTLTYIKTLDEKIGGFKKGSLIILAARPGVGKTAFALDIATRISQRKKVLFFSLEMSYTELFKRVMANINNLPLNELERVYQLDKETKAKFINKNQALRKLKLDIFDKTFEFNGIVSLIKKEFEKEKPSLIVIDYLQLLNIENTRLKKDINRAQEISQITRSLKLLAMELNVPILLLSQLNRNLEQTNRYPRASDLKDSGSIEQDADQIILLHREIKVETMTKTPTDSEIINVIIGKNRSGETGKIELLFKKSITGFRE